MDCWRTFFAWRRAERPPSLRVYRLALGAPASPNRSDAVRITQIKEHAFRDFAGDGPRLQIHNKQRLLAQNFARIFAFLTDTRKNHADVIAKIHGKAHELVGTSYFFDAFDRTDADIKGL